MKKITLLFSCILLGLFAFAQKPAGSIKGILVDSTGKEPLAGATVSVLFEKDSSILTYKITDSTGTFIIKDLANNPYKLLVSFQGLKPFEKAFAITDAMPSVDLGNIIMVKDINTLDDIVLISDVPIQIKGDTTQFNASAFK